MKSALLRKTAIFLVTGCMIATSLFGCGSGNSQSGAPASSAASSVVSPASSASSASSGGAENHISFWTVVPTQSQWDSLYTEFQKENPDIKVDYIHVDSSDEYIKKIQVALSSGSGPDLFTTYQANINQYEQFLEPIKPLADKNWGSGWESKFNAQALKGATTKDGTLIGIPSNIAAEEFILYNKTLEQEAGITDNFEPKTYDDFKALCDKLKGKGITPVAFGAKDTWAVCDVFINLCNQYGPEKVYEAEAGKLSWTDPVFVSAMKAYKQLFDEIFQKGATGLAIYPDARDQYYYSRKSAMFVTGSWHIGSYEMPGGEKWGTKIEKDETGAFLFPQIGPYPSTVTTSVNEIDAINASSQNKDAAWKLFDFLLMGQGAQIFADVLQGSPVRTDIQITSLDKIPHELGKQSVQNLIKLLPTSAGEMRFQYTELQDAVAAAVQNVAAGQDPTKTLQEVQKVSDKIKR